MSRLLTGESADLFDPDTGEWVGVVDRTGREQLLLSGAEAARLRATLLDNTVTGNGYSAMREARAARLKACQQFPGQTVYFNFAEESGSITYEQTQQRAATLNAGTVTWLRGRGVAFNASGAFQFTENTNDPVIGTICDLSTLTGDDVITVAMVYHHAAALSLVNPLFYYGCSSENTCGGWGIVGRTNGKLFFYHRAKGSSTEYTLNLANHDPGDNGNTRTAVCLEIRRHPDDPGWFEIAMHDRPLEAAAAIQTVCLSYNNVPANGDGTGTGPATYSTLGSLTLGAKPGATYTNLTPQLAGNGQLCGLQMLIIQRYRYVPGRVSAVLQDLAADPTTPPLSMFLEADA